MNYVNSASCTNYANSQHYATYITYKYANCATYKYSIQITSYSQIDGSMQLFRLYMLNKFARCTNYNTYEVCNCMQLCKLHTFCRFGKLHKLHKSVKLCKHKTTAITEAS